MKDVLKKSGAFSRIEFWVITTIWVFAFFAFLTNGLDSPSFVQRAPNILRFQNANVPFNFTAHYFIPQLIRYLYLYGTLMVLNFVLVPQLFDRKNVARNVILLVLLFGLSVVVYSTTDTYVRGYLYGLSPDRVAIHREIFRQGLVHCFSMTLIIAAYTFIKYVGIYLLSRASEIEREYPFVRREAIVVFIVWFVGILLLIAGRGARPVVIAWIMIIPSATLVYLAGCYRLIAISLNKKYPFLTYFFTNAMILFALFFVFFFVLAAGGMLNGDEAGNLSVFNSLLQLFVTVPLTWLIFRRVMKGNQQITSLKIELGRSNANFDFLRSQINPHFLFNALNTIYGTAIQEKADRTGEAVLKLSDMMRFMLQENMQETIPLMREIEYLNNYITLQQLRIVNHPEIRIKTNIESTIHTIRVAPMLFIPFVENAFKHGISFREASYISIALEVRDGVINFDVHNSKHLRPANDPEAGKSGIGLNNVRQRLQLVYPDRHELVIRETAHDFFVHLTIQSV